jgi:hypothetical protein
MSFTINTLNPSLQNYVVSATTPQSLVYPSYYSPLPYIPSNATIEPYPSLPSYTTMASVAIAPGISIPTITTITPRLPLAPELDLDNDEETREKVSKYFYYLTLDKWLYGSFAKLLRYLRVDKNQVSISKTESSSGKQDTNEEAALKIKFMEEYVFKVDDIRKLLRTYVKEHNKKWVYIIKYCKSDIKHIIYNFLKERLSRRVNM